MQIYQAYNLLIASELLLPELIEIEQESKPDVIVRFGKLEDMTGIKFNQGGNFRGEVAEVGKFLVHRGCEIIIEPLPEFEAAYLRTILLGPLLSILLRQRGLLVLHASCVDINNKAVAFMGGSGWGKSTLATAFHTQGFNVLTDDVMAVEINTAQPLVFPAYPQFKLWPEAVASFGQETGSLSPVSQNSFKLAYKLPQGFQQKPLPLHRIYVLAKGNNHEITSISPQDAFVELVRHTRAMNLVQEPEFITSHLRLCTEVIKKVSLKRFARKPALEELPNLVQLIEHDINNDIKNTLIASS